MSNQLTTAVLDPNQGCHQIQVLGLVLAEICKMKGLHAFALFDPPKWLIYTPED